MYELVDHWSHDVSEKEYVRFLMALFRRVCEPVADNTAGYGSPVLKMLAPGEYTHTQDTLPHTRHTHAHTRSQSRSFSPLVERCR